MEIRHVGAALLLAVLLCAPFTASAWYQGGYGGYGYEYGYSDYGYYDYGYYDSYSPYYYDTSYYYYPETYTYPSYTYASTPSPSNYSYPIGDTDTFGNSLCDWEGYGRGRCDFNPRQPVYDHWTGTWY